MRIFFSFLFRFIILAYQIIISPLFPPACRYTQTCSSYALAAVLKHGPWKGFYLTLKRILTCHPWGGGGHDLVP